VKVAAPFWINVA
jgi:uncharacterized membrane protein YqaE (UPF0057 family)